MVLNRLKVEDAHVMSKEEMMHSLGGIGLCEYCRTLMDNIWYNGVNGDSWSSGAWEGAAYGVSICQGGGYFSGSC